MRALIFNILFYTLFVIGMLAISPLLLGSRRVTTRGIMFVTKCLVVLQRIFGIRIQVRGKENIPEGGFLIAAKHQSMWETIMLPDLFVDPAFIYKQELANIPLFGLFMRKFDMVPIDRKKGATALRNMTVLAARKIAEGRQLIIFPEGTRRPLGAPPDYKTGIVLLYDVTKAPVLPIAQNSGALWSNYFWRGQTGTIVIDILPLIAAGLPKKEFLQKLQDEIETAMQKMSA
ncbi:MAG: lysophospholipid acyltransferase family protein [Pseudomonadota bacterium]